MRVKYNVPFFDEMVRKDRDDEVNAVEIERHVKSLDLFSDSLEHDVLSVTETPGNLMDLLEGHDELEEYLPHEVEAMLLGWMSPYDLDEWSKCSGDIRRMIVDQLTNTLNRSRDSLESRLRLKIDKTLRTFQQEVINWDRLIASAYRGGDKKFKDLVQCSPYENNLMSEDELEYKYINDVEANSTRAEDELRERVEELERQVEELQPYKDKYHRRQIKIVQHEKTIGHLQATIEKAGK